MCTVSSASEAIEHSFFSGRIHLEDDSKICDAADLGGAVKIALNVLNHASARRSPVSPTSEVVKSGERTWSRT
jgi:hypothetical protein